eukprot:17559-Heterococcus_DN1.PRE.1
MLQLLPQALLTTTAAAAAAASKTVIHLWPQLQRTVAAQLTVQRHTRSLCHLRLQHTGHCTTQQCDHTGDTIETDDYTGAHHGFDDSTKDDDSDTEDSMVPIGNHAATDTTTANCGAAALTTAAITYDVDGGCSGDYECGDDVEETIDTVDTDGDAFMAETSDHQCTGTITSVPTAHCSLVPVPTFVISQSFGHDQHNATTDSAAATTTRHADATIATTTATASGDSSVSPSARRRSARYSIPAAAGSDTATAAAAPRSLDIATATPLPQQQRSRRTTAQPNKGAAAANTRQDKQSQVKGPSVSATAAAATTAAATATADTEQPQKQLVKCSEDLYLDIAIKGELNTYHIASGVLAQVIRVQVHWLLARLSRQLFDKRADGQAACIQSTQCYSP